MTKEELNKYKEMLLQEKKETLESLMSNDSTAKDILENDIQNVNDSIDEASVKITQDLLNITSAKQKQTLLGIEAALRRIDENSFGQCVSCGCQITKERLDTLPWVTMCIKCKNEMEKHQK